MSLLGAGASFYVMWFVVLATVCGAVYYKTSSQSALQFSPEFKAFQKLYLTVYLTMMMADWLQGPYVYALYSEYGFSKGAIGVLFIVGFGSSLLVGTVIGGFADKYGRKMNCLLFAILYGLSCITKHFNNFSILLFGRLLGGVATSILMSAFETWMIHEHRANNFPEEWMASTFSNSTFGSGLVAIIAGILAWILAATFGSVAPFDASLILLSIGAFVIYTRWRENYGEHGSSRTVLATAGAFDSFKKAGRLLITNEKVLLLGVIQSCFESAMYIFVFMWTPALESTLPQDSNRITLPHGVVFAIFMVAIMLGSKAFEFVVAQKPVEHFTRWVFVVSSVALAAPILTSNHTLQLLSFCIFEVCCGLYFPAVGTMRSKYIPEEVRSTVMNIFRVGLNAIVVLTLLNIDTLAQDTVFLFTVLLLTLAVVAQHRLFILAEQTSYQDLRARDADAADQTKSESTA